MPADYHGENAHTTKRKQSAAWNMTNVSLLNSEGSTGTLALSGGLHTTGNLLESGGAKGPSISFTTTLGERGSSDEFRVRK